MSDFTTTPRQNQFETVLVGELSSSSTAPFNITVGTAVSFTPDTGGFYATLEPGTTKEEGLLISAVSGTTWTVATRGIPIAKAGTATTTSHGGGSKIIISNHWEVYDDIATAIATKAEVAGDTFTGLIQFSGTTHAGLKLISLTTTQRLALTPSNGMMVYDSTLGVIYQYIAGAWASVDTGTAVSNATTSVAGKVRLSSQAQVDAGTDTDTDPLVPQSSQIAEAVQQSTWNFAADAEASDTYAITLIPAIDDYVTGDRFIFTANTANTGAATLNVNAKGAKSIVKGDSTALVTGDIAAGQVVEVVYDGTNMVMTSIPNNLVAGGDCGTYHTHPVYAGLLTLNIGGTDATGNTDSTVTTTATPRLIKLQIRAEESSLYYMGWLNATYEGTTLKFNDYNYAIQSDPITEIDLAYTATFVATAGNIVLGTGGNTQTLTFSINSVSATTCVIRCTNTKAGSGCGTVTVKIGYDIIC